MRRNPDRRLAARSAVGLEIGSDEREGLAMEGLHVLEPSRARNLFRQDPMEPGIDAMRADRGGDEVPHGILDRLQSCGARERPHAASLAEQVRDVLLAVSTPGDTVRRVQRGGTTM